MINELESHCRLLLVDEIGNFLKVDKRTDIQSIYMALMKKTYVNYVVYSDEVEQCRKILYHAELPQNSLALINNYLSSNVKEVICKDVLTYFLEAKVYKNAPKFLKHFFEKLNVSSKEFLPQDTREIKVNELVHAAIAAIFISVGNDHFIDKKEYFYIRTYLSDLYLLMNKLEIEDYSLRDFFKSRYVMKEELFLLKDEIIKLVKCDGVVSLSEKRMVERIYQSLRVKSSIKESRHSVLPLIHMMISFSDGEFHEQEKKSFLELYGLDYFKHESRAILLIDMLLNYPSIFKSDVNFFKSLLPREQNKLDTLFLMYIINDIHYKKTKKEVVIKKIRTLSILAGDYFNEKITRILSGKTISEEVIVFCSYFFKESQLRDNKSHKVDVSYFQRLFESINIHHADKTYDLLVRILLADDRICSNEYAQLHDQFSKYNLDYKLLKKALYRYEILEGVIDIDYEEYERYEKVVS